jgi:tRNA (mo5U34)-methyltransferase
MKARDANDTARVQRQVALVKSLGWYHSIALPGGEITPGLQTSDQLPRRVRMFPIPDDLRGKRVLDIGAWDGWFSFEMERRGANVVAVDAVQSDKFLYAREKLGSKVQYHVIDVYDLSPSDLGVFDIVLFLGVLYHLKHPLLALERVCAMSTDLVCVESLVMNDGFNPEAIPVMEFYETTELGGQFDNWLAPNVACLMAFCRTAGFARAQFEGMIDDRAHVTCFRKWNGAPGAGRAPQIVSLYNSVSLDLAFSGTKDEYVSLWFNGGSDLTVDDIFPEVGGFGSRPAKVLNAGPGGWNAVFKLPLGLPRGWSTVRLRVRDSDYSNVVRLGIDIDREQRRERIQSTFDAPEFKIEIVADGKTWERNVVRIQPDACISLWVRNLPNQSDVCVRLDGYDLPAVYIGELNSEGLQQVNALIPPGIKCGLAQVNVAGGSAVTPPVEIELCPGVKTT